GVRRGVSVGGLGPRRPRGDGRGIISRYIRDDERDDLGGRGRGRESAALERGEMLAHAVHFPNRRAAGEQLPIDALLVLERQAGRRCCEQRRSTARDEAEDEIVLVETLDQFAHAQRRIAAIGVGHRMRGLDNLYLLAGSAMTISGDDEAGQIALPILLDRQRHGGAGLSGSHDDGTALWRLWQEGRHPESRVGGG